MVIRITSTACPVWFSTVPVNTLTRSGIADGDGQRGVLGEVEILARQRRNDDAQRLRDDHEPQHLPVRKAERCAASFWPFGTPRMPARTISAMKLAV